MSTYSDIATGVKRCPSCNASFEGPNEQRSDEYLRELFPGVGVDSFCGKCKSELARYMHESSIRSE